MKKISLFVFSSLFIGSVFAGDLPRTELPPRQEFMKIGSIAAPQNNPHETDNDEALGIDGAGSVGVYVEEIVKFPPANESSDINKETEIESLSDLKLEGVEGESRNDGEDRIEEIMITNKADLKLEGIEGEARNEIAPTDKDVYRVDLSFEKEKIESVEKKTIPQFLCEDGSVVSRAGDCEMEEAIPVQESGIKIEDIDGEIRGSDPDFYRIEGHQGVVSEADEKGDNLERAQDHNGSRSNTTESLSIDFESDGETEELPIESRNGGGGAGKVNVQDLSFVNDPIPGIDIIVKRVFEGVDNDCDGGCDDIKMESDLAEILQNTLPNFAPIKNSKIGVEKEDGKKVLEVKGVEKSSLFGLFEMGLEVEAKIDESGKLIELEKPWYAIFTW